MQFGQRSQTLAIEHARHIEEDAHKRLPQPGQTAALLRRVQTKQPGGEAFRVGARQRTDTAASLRGSMAGVGVGARNLVRRFGVSRLWQEQRQRGAAHRRTSAAEAAEAATRPAAALGVFGAADKAVRRRVDLLQPLQVRQRRGDPAAVARTSRRGQRTKESRAHQPDRRLALVAQGRRPEGAAKTHAARRASLSAVLAKDAEVRCAHQRTAGVRHPAHRAAPVGQQVAAAS